MVGPPYSVASLLVGDPSRVWANRYLAVIKAFFDDSGSHSTGHLYVVAGYVATADQWQRFENEWFRTLRLHGLGYVKAEQAHRRSKEFAGRSRAPVEQIMSDFAQIVARNVTHEFSVQVPRLEFNQVMNEVQGINRPRFKSPYLLCYREMYVYLKTLVPSYFSADDKTVDVMLDDQALVKGIIQDAAKEQEHIVGAATIATLSFGNDKVVLPLQAADMIAWSLHRAASSPAPQWASTLLALPAMRIKVDESKMREFALGLRSAVRAEAKKKGASDGRRRRRSRGFNAGDADRPDDPGAQA